MQLPHPSPQETSHDAFSFSCSHTLGWQMIPSSSFKPPLHQSITVIILHERCLVQRFPKSNGQFGGFRMIKRFFAVSIAVKDLKAADKKYGDVLRYKTRV